MQYSCLDYFGLNREQNVDALLSYTKPEMPWHGRRLPGTTRGAGWRNVGLEKWPFEKAQKSREGGWLLDA